MTVALLALDPLGSLFDAETRSPRADGMAQPYLPLGLGLVLDRIRSVAPRGTRVLDAPILTTADDLVAALAGEGSAACLFSDYIWSIDANLEASRAAKRAAAHCLTVHGGPSAPKHAQAAAAFLAQHPEVDVIVRGEGEETCAELLTRYPDTLGGSRNARDALFREVKGITFLDPHGAVVRTPDRPLVRELDQLPSPYLSGLFDRLLAERHPGEPLPRVPHASLETNRGCPYGCSFCDWGSATLQKIRLFGVERVRAELEWMARHRTEDVFIADANFGMLPRDVEIASIMAEVKRAHGYPKEITSSYAKNGSKHLSHIFRIWKQAGFRFEPVISLQTTDQPTLVALGRANIRSAKHLELSDTFRALDLSVRVHLMLGLPGQTVASWMTDLQGCFERQEGVQMFLTRLLPNAPMADPEYVARYGIRTDASDTVIETTSFSLADRELMLRIGYAYLLYANWGILKHLLRYLQWDYGIRALDFIREHVQEVSARPEANPEARALLGPIFQTSSQGVLEQAPHQLPNFQRSGWGRFYAEISAFTSRRYGVAHDGALDAVLRAQEAVMPRVGAAPIRRLALAHDVCAYERRGVEAMRASEAPSEPLTEFGPGELVVSDPLRRNRPDLSCGTPVNGPDPRWELESALSRTSAGDPQHPEPVPAEPSKDSADLLYLHPSGHLNDLVVPMGALSAMNAAHATKLGRYAFEVTDDEISQARVLAIDVHWALALPGFERLVAHVRALRPDLPIIVGGITAGHYAEELLARHPIDYVIRGDSEVAFARLVDALLAGQQPRDLPNVFGRDLPAPTLQRMTPAEFDATDSVTCDWFPTYASVTNWDAVAFGPGCTISVTRGCPKRCPGCCGSYAKTYGDGYLMRTPAGVARLLERAEAAGARNVRLIVDKPAPKQLRALLHGLAERGPFDLEGDVGIYLCTAPEPEDLPRLEAAFRGKVTLSLVPPEEHHPAPSAERLARERQAWRRVADYAGRSEKLRLDVWSTQRSDVDQVKADLAAADNDRVKVSYGGVWEVTRPIDGQAVSLDSVIEAVAPVWTFYAARLLSPALAKMLAPFRFLDELDGDPLAAAKPGGALDAYAALIACRWRKTRLPTLPSLAFALLPVKASATSARPRGGVYLSGALSFAATQELEVLGAPIPLNEQLDHRGVDLRARVFRLPRGAHALAIVPRPLDGSPIDSAWLEDVGSATGALVLDLGQAAAQARELVIHLRVQDARAFALDASGEPVARGVANLRYFRPAPPRGPQRARAGENRER